MLELTTKPLSKLATVSRLLEVLHANSIIYCHWKSNEHLDASMQGLTDLDVLFLTDQKETAESILHDLGFKPFHAIRQKRYKDIADFLILDPESGRLVHLHAHFRLTMGEPYLKGYQLSSAIEKGILVSREFDETYGIFCIQPSFELVMLFIRESLRLRLRDVLLSPFRDRLLHKEFLLREYHWLRRRTSGEEIARVIKSYFNNDTAIYRIVTGEFQSRHLRELSLIVKNGHFFTQLYTPAHATAKRWCREVTVVFARKLAKLLDRPILFKRINPRGGRIIAVIGADGSGKSTVTENLRTTFESKLDVYKIYFGRGDGKASRTRKLLKGGKSLFETSGQTKPVAQKDSGSPRSSHVRNLYKCVNALLVAREKKRNLKLMQVAKDKGALVICDRYPQNQIMGYNDGPMLNDFCTSRNPLFRAFAKIEAKVYTQAERLQPDVVFKLVADAAEVEKRKPGETSPERLKMKIEGIKDLKFKSPTKVFTVDASRPLHEVLSFIKNEVWRAL